MYPTTLAADEHVGNDLNDLSTMSLFHHVTENVVRSISHIISISPSHHALMSLHAHVTMSPCHSVNMPPMSP